MQRCSVTSSQFSNLSGALSFVGRVDSAKAHACMPFSSTRGPRCRKLLQESVDARLIASNRVLRTCFPLSRSRTSAFIFQGDNLLVFDVRTLKIVSTLPTSKKVLLQLEYNHARDEIISGGSDGCFFWRLEAIPCKLFAIGAVVCTEKPMHWNILPGKRVDEGERMLCLKWCVGSL